MKVPKPLKKGDTIALISVSGSVSEEELRLAVRSVERLGFRVYERKTTRARYGYFAGPDEMRAEELMNLFANPEIDGIICIRGGYGAYRILPFLDFDLLKANAKVFAGRIYLEIFYDCSDK